MTGFSKSKLILTLAAFIMMVTAIVIPLPDSIVHARTASSKTGPEPAWAFPFAAGTSMNIGPLGLHDHNFKSMQDDRTGTIYTFKNPRYSDASLDMVLQPEHKGTSSIPTVSAANGTVLAVWAVCQLVLIDHGNGWWAVYLHMANIQVVSGETVTTGSIIGYPTTKKPTQKNCGSVESTAEHVHIAFLNGSGTTGAYVSMLGSTFCGYPVVELNNDPTNIILQGLTQQKGQVFNVPACGEGVVTEFGGLTPNSCAQHITSGPDGNLWFTEECANQIGRITPTGSVTEFGGLTPGSMTDSGITSGSDGNLWFTEAGINKIGRITPTGSVTEFGGLTPNSFPWGITSGPDGNLWFTESNVDKIGRITPTGSVTEFPLPFSGSSPSQITSGPDGNLWFTEGNVDKIGRITPTGSITEFSMGITPGSVPYGITSGPDGNLWFTENGGDSGLAQVGRITPTGSVTEFSMGITPNSDLQGITSGPDGNLWFVENAVSKIGRITPTGSVTEFGGLTGVPYFGITSGSDGNLWFTEPSINKIGRITP